MQLEHAALAASEGGELAVRGSASEDSEDAMLLLEPHFVAHIELPDEVARSLQAGLRVNAHFGYRRLPLTQRFAIAFAGFGGQPTIHPRNLSRRPHRDRNPESTPRRPDHSCELTDSPQAIM